MTTKYRWLIGKGQEKDMDAKDREKVYKILNGLGAVVSNPESANRTTLDKRVPATAPHLALGITIQFTDPNYARFRQAEIKIHGAGYKTLEVFADNEKIQPISPPVHTVPEMAGAHS